MTVAPRHVNIHEDKENEHPTARSRLPGLTICIFFLQKNQMRTAYVCISQDCSVAVTCINSNIHA